MSATMITALVSLRTDLTLPTAMRRGVRRRQRRGARSRPGTGSAVSPDGGKAIPALVADNPFLQRERTLMPLQGLGRPQFRGVLTPLPMLRVAYCAAFVYGPSSAKSATPR